MNLAFDELEESEEYNKAHKAADDAPAANHAIGSWWGGSLMLKRLAILPSQRAKQQSSNDAETG